MQPPRNHAQTGNTNATDDDRHERLSRPERVAVVTATRTAGGQHSDDPPGDQLNDGEGRQSGGPGGYAPTVVPDGDTRDNAAADNDGPDSDAADTHADVDSADGEAEDTRRPPPLARQRPST